MSAYATINEAYGEDFNKKKKKDRKNKKGKKQSACHYYAQRYEKTQSQKNTEPYNLGGLDTSDVYSKYDKNAPNKEYDLYSNRQDFIKANKDNLKNCDIKEEQDYFEKLYEEHDFKPVMSRDGDNLMQVEPTEYEEVKFDNRINRGIKSAMNIDIDYETDDDTESIGTSLEAKAGTEVGTNVGSISKVETNVKEPKYQTDKNYMDLGLYLISGILLIFILEQFVQIGLMMRESRSGDGSRSGGGSVNYINDFNYPPPAMYHPSMYQPMYHQSMYNSNYKGE
jgi:hypothetical protein